MEEDVLLLPELTALSHRFPGRLSLHLVVRQPPADQKRFYEVGLVQTATLKKILDKRGSFDRTLVCGPPDMEAAVHKSLRELGFVQTSHLLLNVIPVSLGMRLNFLLEVSWAILMSLWKARSTRREKKVPSSP